MSWSGHHDDPTLNQPCRMEADSAELVPVEDYNVGQARVKACISWLIAKAYGGDIPGELQPAFVLGNRGQQLLKLAVINGLVSSDIYCKLCSNVFADTSQKWQGHMDVLQALSRRGIYATDPHESAVTDTLLAQKTPFKLSCHLSVIEALMTAHTQELVTVEKVVHAVRKFSSFNASSELPYDTEDAILFWINKVCGTVRHKLSKACPPSPPVMIPVMDDLLKDSNDGCCLATLISYYCPQALRLQDIGINDPVSIADCLHNLQCVRQFVQDHVPARCAHLTVSDMFHAHADLKPAIVMFFAELFYWLEGNKISIARALDKTSPVTPEERPSTAKTLTSQGVPISNATKRSFQQPATPDQGPGPTQSLTSPDKHSVPGPRQPLLPRRPRQGEAVSDGGQGPGRSVRAWEDTSTGVGDPARGLSINSTDSQLTEVSALNHSHESAPGMLGNVSIETDASIDLSDGSVDISDFERKAVPRQVNSNQMLPSDTLGDYMELESVSPASTRRANGNQISNPNGNHGNPHSSVSTSSTQSSRQLEPLMPSPTKPSKEKSSPHQTKQVESGERTNSSRNQPPKYLNLNLSTEGSKAYTTYSNDDSESDTPDEDYKTPSVESVPLPGHSECRFFGDDPAGAGSLLAPDTPVAESFVVQDQSHTAETARAAGLPVVDDSNNTRQAVTKTPRMPAPATSIAPKANNTPKQQAARPESLKVNKPIASNKDKPRESPQTSFAEIKKQNTPPNATPEPQTSNIKSKPAKVHKKTTFAALPNQTTWQKNAEEISLQRESEDTSSQDSSPSSSELVDIKMRLEERRRQIESEKRRMEFQWTKQRQRLGKQAFIHVINRGKSETDLQKIQEDSEKQDAPKAVSRRKKVVDGSVRPTAASKVLSDRTRYKVSSAPASREQSTERLQERVAPNVDQYKLNQPSTEPARPHHAKQASDPTKHWPSDSESSHHKRTTASKPRPKSYHAPELMTQSMPSTGTDPRVAAATQRGGTQSLTSSTDNPKVGSYTSLDRLNCSLSELQGEIMRLSLQQDQIKSLVVNDQGSTKSTEASSGSTTTTTESDKYYLYPQDSSAGEPDVTTRKSSTDHTQSPRSSPKHVPPEPIISQPTYTPQRPSSATYASQTAPYPAMAPYAPPPPPQAYPPYHPVYPMPQYGAVPPQYPPNLYQQYPQNYPQNYPKPWSNDNPGLHPIQPPGQPALSDYASPVGSGGEREGSPTHYYPASPTQHSSHSPLQSPHSPAGPLPRLLPSPGPLSPPLRAQPASPTPPSPDPHPLPPNSGFFVTLDESERSERKPKPRLGSRKEAPVEPVEPRVELVEPPPPPRPPVSPVGFVIQEDDEQTEESEMEKKKKKILEQQVKRRQEILLKKMKKDGDVQKQREEQILKQERAEQKKAEERSRREAIYQGYLRRKAEDSEEEPKSSPSPANTTPQKPARPRPRAARPKSQTPVGVAEDVQSQSSQSHSSQEDIHHRSRSPEPPRKGGHDTGRVMTLPCGNGDNADGYQQLAFGGLTHRRPPTPDHGRGMDGELIPPHGASDYSGPKLFKKPSQKSNRTIMINAISHCCLAGSVNTSVKNKVLEVIARSEAKHFVILFRDAGMQFKGVYTYDPDREEVLRLHGVGPKQLTSTMLEKFYKYNSGGKNFSEVTSTKHLSATIDAVVITNSLWQKKAATTRRPANQY